MKTEKLSVNRCFKIEDPDRDDINLHRWSDEPAIGLTEAGPIAWWICTRCPARTLHDPETQDGFAAESIVVYPPSCFGEDEIAPGQDLLDPMRKVWRMLRVDAAEDAEREAREEMIVVGAGPLVVVQAAGGGTLMGRASIFKDWIILPRCPCPRRASGAREHLGGCVEHEALVERNWRAMDEELAMSGARGEDDAEPAPLVVHVRLREELEPDGSGLSLCGAAGALEGEAWGSATCSACLAATAAIVHPPTDPAPPSEELRRAIAEADEDTPTVRIPRATIFGHPLDPAAA